MIDQAPPLEVEYFYRMSLPAPIAAPIQILNTLHHLALLGNHVRLHVDKMGPVEDCLAYYGLPINPNFRIEAVPGGYARSAGLLRGRRFRKFVQGVVGAPVSGAGRIIMSRDERGLEFYETLERQRLPPGVLYVHEAHRVCSTYADERMRNEKQRGRNPQGAGKRSFLDAGWERRVVSHCAGLVVLTEPIVEDYAQSFGLEAPSIVLPSGTVFADRPATLQPERDLDIVYVGKLMGRKGTDVLLLAMKQLPEYSLTLVGGDDESIAVWRERCGKMGLGGRVRFVPFVPPLETEGYLRRARVGVCILPAGVSIAERYTSPIKILDMMACGVPIVATDLPSVSRILRHGETGWLTPPDDSRSLAAGIRKLLADRALAEALARNALEESGNYSYTVRAKRLDAFLRSLVSNSPSD